MSHLLDTQNRKPLGHKLVWKGQSLLVWLGWIAITVIVFSRIYQNMEVYTPVVNLDDKFYFRDDFTHGPDPVFWAAFPVSSIGRTCLYPDYTLTKDGMLVLSLKFQENYCNGLSQNVRGQILASRHRFIPPFHVAARFKVASNPGSVSAFFTYTDPINGKYHYENDFEFPGGELKRDHLWINYFGRHSPPLIGDFNYIRLDLDATKKFAVYSIDVYPNRTIWKINDKIVRIVDHEDEADSQQVIFNIWFNQGWAYVYDIVPFAPSGNQDFIIDWAEVSALKNDNAESR